MCTVDKTLQIVQVIKLFNSILHYNSILQTSQQLDSSIMIEYSIVAVKDDLNTATPYPVPTYF